MLAVAKCLFESYPLISSIEKGLVPGTTSKERDFMHTTKKCWYTRTLYLCIIFSMTNIVNGEISEGYPLSNHSLLPVILWLS